MSKFIKSVAAAAVLATSATGTQAATLNTDVDVTLPEIIALYCFESVDIKVTADGLATALGGDNGGVTLGAAAEVSVFNPDLAAQDDSGVGTFATSVNLDLTNVCAFRALVGSAGVSVAVSQPAGTTMAHQNPESTAVIEASGASLLSASTVTSGLGLAAAATPISVRVPLDLSNASEPGKYSKADLFTVTVSAL